MHILQPKHVKLKPDEVKKLLAKYNLSYSQLPKIKADDAAAPEGSVKGDILRLDRKDEDGKINTYYRIVA